MKNYLVCILLPYEQEFWFEVKAVSTWDVRNQVYKEWSDTDYRIMAIKEKSCLQTASIATETGG